MKANLPQREPQFLQAWENSNLYQKIRKQSKGRPSFVLHFGPPYANGHIHIGHALSEILKDIVNKTYQMKGYDAAMIPGWDCHGLPIEWKIEEQYRAKGANKDEVDPLDFRSECRAFAQKWSSIQKEEFKRLGILADFENPYSTMDFKTEAKIVEELGKFLMNGSLYRGLKPVLWSVVEKTALAEAEVEYKNHTSDSIYVAFKCVKTSLKGFENVEFVIWTTTPWTIPANRAIAFGPEVGYVVVDVEESDHEELKNRSFVIAEDLVKDFCFKLGILQYTTRNRILGSQLQGAICAHPWQGKGYDFEVPLLPGEHVTTETGTGLVHTAPSHGLEDFEVGKQFGLEVPEMVQGDGTYAKHVPLFAGEHIYKVNPHVLEELKIVNALLHTSKLVHSYPHSWRSKAPLIYRATAQWFISMDKNNLRSKALNAIDDVAWFPSQGKNRIKSMVESRPDWCISRQRSWGTPITLFVHKESGEPLKDEAVFKRIVEAVSKEGAEAWFSSDPKRFLGNDYNPDDYEKVTDILDVWFDSGCSHAFVLENNPHQNWPADVYFEGSDQHRGWFQASLLQSCGTRGVAPYKKVVTHGFVVDEKGYKMSKSIGNVVTPSEVIDKYGADMLRLWIVNSDYTDDLRIGNEILKHQEDIYRRFRNTLRYLLGALDGFKESEVLSYQEMPALEQWVLHRLYEIKKHHDECIESFDFSNFYMALHNFCAVELSAFYFDIRKDSLYCDDEYSIKRRAARTVMNTVFLNLVHWLAPALSFTAEEAWQEYSKQTGGEPSSIHEQHFPNIPEEWCNEELSKKWEDIRQIRKVITSALEIERAAKTIGSSLQANVAIYVNQEKAGLLQNLDLAELSITSDAELVIAQPPAGAVTLEDVPGVGVVVNTAEGEKCQRCWRILPEVGIQEGRQHPSICLRCEDVILALEQKAIA